MPTLEPLTDEGYDVLVAAMNLARKEQIRTVKALKDRLAQMYPQTSTAVIDNALRTLAQRLVAT